MMKITNYLAPFLKEGTTESSLRLSVFQVVTTCCTCILIITIGTVIKLNPDWIGYGVAVGSLGTVIGLALWGKNASKDKEV